MSPIDFHPLVRRALLELGVDPRPEDDPARIRDFLNDLYRFELWGERASLMEIERVLGRQPVEERRRRILRIRRRYERLMALPVEQWKVESR